MVAVSKFGAGDIHGNADIFAWAVTGSLNGGHDKVEWFVVAFAETWSVTTLIAYGRSVAALLENLGECVEDFGAHTDGIIHIRCADWDNHVFLEIS